MSSNDYENFLKELKIFLNDEKLKEKKIFEKEIKEENLSFGEKIINEVNSVKNIEYEDIETFTVSIKELEETDKPREKLYKFGLENLSEYELIAILIRSGSKKEDVLTLSKKLWIYMSKFHRISEITINDLMEIDGIGLSKACSLISALELFKRLNSDIEKANFVAEENYKNQFNLDDTYDLEYINMRRNQAHILYQMDKIARSISLKTISTDRVEDFIKKLALERRNYERASELLEEFYELDASMKSIPLPVSRPEFEDRARLFAIMRLLEEFLQAKSEFASNNS